MHTFTFLQSTGQPWLKQLYINLLSQQALSSFCTGKGLECFPLGLWQSCSTWIQAGYNLLPDSHWTLLFGQWFDYQEYRQSQNVSISHSPAIHKYLFTHLVGKNSCKSWWRSRPTYSHIQTFSIKTCQWCSKAKINFCQVAFCCFC